MDRTIRIPLGDNVSASECVFIFPDELPAGDLDYNDIIDLLRSVLAPLKLWRSCAVEYYRQGFRTEFEYLLNEIIESLNEEHVEKIYRAKGDYTEGMADIFNALAASELSDFARLKDTALSDDKAKRAADEKARDEKAKKVVEYLTRAEVLQSGINEYTNLVRGFYQLRQAQNDRLQTTTITQMPEFKNAENAFKNVYDIATKRLRKKFLFGALVGMGIIAYTREKYSVAMEHLSKALQTHPKCSAAASVRVAIASCCFKLKQFDRARSIIEKALAIDPANADALVQMALLEQVAAQKDRDRSKRLEYRAHAHEYCLLAAAMDASVPSTLMAMNHVANHCFHTWKILVGKGDVGGRARVTGPWELQVELSQSDYRELLIREKDPVRVRISSGSPQLFAVQSTTAVLLSASTQQQQTSTAAGVQEPAGGALLVTITLSGDTPLKDHSSSSSGNGCGTDITVDVKECYRAYQYAQDVLKKTSIAGVKAESCYIIGRFYHSQGKFGEAMEYYKEALKLRPDLVLAMFNFAQILLSRNELAGALELFEKVLSLHPDDRDTHAYVMLVRALHKKEPSQLDRVREVAPGFAHEIDLWLLQAQLRQGDNADYVSALRCYMHALELMEQQRSGGAGPIDPRVLCNIAVLHHSLGKTALALDFCRRALVAQQTIASAAAAVVTMDTGTAEDVTERSNVNPLFKNQLFEGVFFSWCDADITVRPDWHSSNDTSPLSSGSSSGNVWMGIESSSSAAAAVTDAGGDSVSTLCSFEVCLADGSSLAGDAASSNMSSLFAVGDDVLLGMKQQQSMSEGAVDEGLDALTRNVVHTVVSVSPTGFITRSHVHRSLLAQFRIDASGQSRMLPLSVRRKVPGCNFAGTAVTLSYNFARILEDVGHTNAAKEVYVQLLKQHPSFIECYLRLSRMARDAGRLDEASVWVSRALTVEESDPDAGVSLGDLYARGLKWDEAKKHYEKVVVKNRHDARTMLSLGNMYFANLSSNPDKYLKDSYKFFHHVLMEDCKNVYAANGLGMVCAQKGELDVAREIISRAREAGLPLSEDICCNLAHVHLAQGRFVDAEMLYQAALKTLPRSSSSSGGSAAKQSDRVNSAFECMSYAEFRHGRHSDALLSLLRGLHNDPSCLRGWYNVAIVRSDIASQYKADKGDNKVDEILDAMENLRLARRMFHFLGSASASGAASTQSTRGLPYKPSDAVKKESVCGHNEAMFADELERAKVEEKQHAAEREEKEAQHQLRMQKKQEDLDKIKQAEHEAKVKDQEKAKQLKEIKGPKVTLEVGISDAGGSGRGEGNMPEKKRKRKAATAAGGDDDEDGGAADGAGEVSRARRKAPRAASCPRATTTTDDIFGSDSEEENDEDNDDGGNAIADATAEDNSGTAAASSSSGRTSSSRSRSKVDYKEDDDDNDDDDDNMDVEEAEEAATTIPVAEVAEVAVTEAAILDESVRIEEKSEVKTRKIIQDNDDDDDDQ